MNMNLLPSIQSTSSALNAYQQQLEIVAQNIANAQTTQTEKGTPYQRQIVNFEALLEENRPVGVQVGEIVQDTRPGPRMYQPSHPHAGADGYVQMPNVNLTFEMVDMIKASRAYEANLSVVKTSRQMAQKALEIGR